MIGFDEGGHGYADPTQQSLFAWLFGTTAGWGVLAGLGLTMVYAASRGRRFGRAVPLPDDRLRRESVEYIQAMATLFRRSGQRSEILRHYDGQLRRRLSERYAVDPRLEAVELLKTVIYRDPSLDETQLRRLLLGLAQPRISEAGLVSLLSELDDFLRRLS